MKRPNMTRRMIDSGIEWIGEIPEDWQLVPARYLYKSNKKIVGFKENEYERLSLTMKGVLKKSKYKSEGLQPSNFNSYQILNVNQLVFKLIDLQNVSTSRVGISPYKGIVSPAYIIIDRKNDSTNNKFYYYWYMSIYLNKVFNLLGDAGVRSNINSTELLDLKVPRINAKEQFKISNALDIKCQKIEDIKSTIEKEIQTLEDYKKSIITEAVTKGLDKNVEMKDSGIEWIGEIPKHWEIKKGKYILKLLKRTVRDDDEVITCFRDGIVTLRSNRREDGFTFADQEIGYQGINKGDLVVHGMDGFAGAIGISDSRGKGSPVLNVLDSAENKWYLALYLRVMAYSDVFTALATGIRVRSVDLRWKKLSELPYPVPPIGEQEEILRYINKKFLNINRLIIKKRKQLETLEEYKKSLIYEYVTGKKEVE